MSSAAEVLVKLVVDSNAPKATADLKHGLDKAGASQRHLTKELFDGKANMAALGSVAGAGYAALVAGAAAGGAALVGLAIGATHAFLESEKQVRALAGTLTLLDSSGTSFSDMMSITGDLKDELEGVAMAVGTTDDALVAAFTDVVERGGKTIDQAQELTEAMANAGRAVPGGIGVISGAFEQIEMGAVRAKNPIVGMIAATHLLQGNAKQVAKQMQAMTPEEQMKLAEKAIANMSKKMKDVPLSIEEMSSSMKVFVGNLFEDAGQPIVHGLMPLFTELRKFAFDNQGIFKSVAKEFGGAVGKVVDVALPVSKEIFAAISSSAGEMRKMINALGPVKDVFTYIYENKDVFAKTMGDVMKDMISAGRALFEVMQGMGNVVTHVADAAKLLAGGKFSAEEKQKEAVTGATGVRAAAREVKAGGTMDPAVYNRIREQYVSASVEAGAKLVDASAAFDEVYRRAMDDHIAVTKQIGVAQNAVLMGDTAAFVAAFDIAAKDHDGATQAGIASFLKDNESMAEALRIKGPDIFKTGSEGFIKALDAAGMGEQAKKLSEGWKAGAKGALTVGKGAQVNQYIGTVNVKQDFKDIDPERVAIVFRNDLAKHGVARLQPLGAKAFGS